MAKKKPVKRKSSKKNNSSKILLYVAWILALVALVLSGVVAGYYLGYMENEKEIVQKEKTFKKPVPKSVHNRLKDVLKEQKTKQTIKKSPLKKEKKVTFVSASHEVDFKESAKIPKPLPRVVRVSSTRPKLAIVIDDVATKAHVKAINSLHLRLTKSFLPPRTARPHTPELARAEKFYMVHLPLEAQSFHAEESNTLRITDSQEKITKRVKQIKKWFPAVEFINNHTGSKFTSDELAMKRLISALEKNGIHFIDSRTIATTKAPKVLKEMGLPYVYRDVFLDHHMDKAYVKGQIRKAVEFAKIHKTAIAIGHPHPNTLQALRESKELLKQVDLVYVKAVY